jgi:hypothetical protein
MSAADKLLAVAVIACLAARPAPGAAPADRSADEPPKSAALTETLEKRLVQLDVAVEGDRDAIRGITAQDFVLYVGEHEVAGLIVDRLCGDGPPPATPTLSDRPPEIPAPGIAPTITRPRATYVFFFDQPHLTMAGRSLSLDTTADLIKRLVVEGSRASIVSSAKRLETIVPLTGERGTLLAGLERLRTDLRQWDSYSETEEGRLGDLERSLHPCLPATMYAREEWMVVRKSTERLASVVSVLAEVPAPRALVYFGDSLRQRAGLHFIHFAREDCGPATVTSAELIPSAAAEFDALTSEAVGRGVHFYTIQAEGMLVYRPGWDAERHRHAQDALVSLAAETGGEAFLGGASNKFIADRLESLTSCRLLLSFPPGDLPRDKAMNVTLELHVPKVKVRAQGRIVVPTPASIERSRLLAAFVNPTSSDDGSLRALLIPRTGDGKVWKASVQLRLRPTGFPDNSAELGASIVRQDTVTDHFASSIATKSGTRAMVLEKSFDIAPGAFAVVAVARDAKRGDFGSSRIEADWPNPAKSVAAIAPIAALQTSPAAMSTDGAASSLGSLARDVDELIDPSASVTLASVVCRGAKTKNPVIVERWFDGGARDEFAPLTIAESDAPCLQTVDVVPAGRLLPGVIDYRIVARVGEEVVAQERRTLRVGVSP